MKVVKKINFEENDKESIEVVITLNLEEASSIFHDLLDVTPQRISFNSFRFRQNLKKAIGKA